MRPFKPTRHPVVAVTLVPYLRTVEVDLSVSEPHLYCMHAPQDRGRGVQLSIRPIGPFSYWRVSLEIYGGVKKRLETRNTAQCSHPFLDVEMMAQFASSAYFGVCGGTRCIDEPG